MSYSASCFAHPDFRRQSCPDCQALTSSVSLRGMVLLTGTERSRLDTIRERNALDPMDRLPLHHWDELTRDLDRDVTGEVES